MWSWKGDRETPEADADDAVVVEMKNGLSLRDVWIKRSEEDINSDTGQQGLEKSNVIYIYIYSFSRRFYPKRNLRYLNRFEGDWLGLVFCLKLNHLVTFEGDFSRLSGKKKSN